MENALSIVNDYDIAKSSKHLKCFVMGTNDLSTELGLEENLKRTALQTSFEKCMMATKAYKLSILDGVYNDIRDSNGFEEECVYSHGLGFDGKTLIHPSQIGLANDIFGIESSDIQNAEKVVSAWSDAKAKGEGVAVLDGTLVENLHYAEAQRVLAFAKALKNDG